MLPRNHPDRIRIAFDDRRLVANAGLLLPATLARHLGLPELVDHHLDLGDAPGRANTGDKLMTLGISPAQLNIPKPGAGQHGGQADDPRHIPCSTQHPKTRGGPTRGTS